MAKKKPAVKKPATLQPEDTLVACNTEDNPVFLVVHKRDSSVLFFREHQLMPAGYTLEYFVKRARVYIMLKDVVRVAVHDRRRAEEDGVALGVTKDGQGMREYGAYAYMGWYPTDYSKQFSAEALAAFASRPV